MTAKIISIISPKGGVGKSTTATNLAADFALKGFSVALVDAEEHGTTIDWNDAGVKNLHVFEGYSRTITQTIEALAKKHDLVIVDTAGNNLTLSTTSENLQTLVNSKAVSVSDLVLIPVEPTPLSIRKTITFDPIINKAVEGKGKAFTFLMSYQRNTVLSAQCLALLKSGQLETPYLGVTIRDATVVPQAEGMMQSVCQYAPRSNVAQDFKKLAKAVLANLSMEG
ncbi:ParA family protein [Enterovibrio paralichthyis]|uniref:ParA family protein n=1 Tax=Enterovibrio paralichthyis TaxID=2853805 RepID=UPI001C469B67|nr:AAA family ATPase [Enterovibrio paralichthyis]MBV7300753.1 AAA family ATPase [Enterovibrio paralichthyis]